MTALTDLDRQLLSALREDGRASVASLARKLGVARATVNSRLDRLLASGTIVGFTARVRDDADPLAIHAITLIAVEGRSANRVIRELRGLLNVEKQKIHIQIIAVDVEVHLPADEGEPGAEFAQGLGDSARQGVLVVAFGDFPGETGNSKL